MALNKIIRARARAPGAI